MQTSDIITDIKDRIQTYRSSDVYYPDDPYAIICLEEAVAAVEEGNFGIGCVILDANNELRARGRNQMFVPHFRSDAHAEMVSMNALEKSDSHLVSMRGYTLYTSLESCPMCMARLILSGCERVLYMADDPKGGMVHLRKQLPPVWQTLSALPRQKWEVAQCHPFLRQLAAQIFMINSSELNTALGSR